MGSTKRSSGGGFSVYVFGAGKVGTALARALRRAGARVTLRPARKGLPARPIDADLLVLAVRDRELGSLAQALADRELVSKRTACVHVAGAAGPEVLAPLRATSAGVGQMHPMISFADPATPPRLLHGNVHVQGDPAAVKRANRAARLLGMTPRTFDGLDPVGYHAAAGLVANGAAALAALGAELLSLAGVPRDVAPRLLGPLLASVADNVAALGFPAALTGPVRRGDPGAVGKHLGLLREKLPRAVPLFVEAGLAQLPLARALGDAPSAGFDQIEILLRSARTASAGERE